jgi:hypothetical protein
LQTTPRWQCNVTPAQITWRYQAKARKYFVDWTETSPTKFAWEAWSKPVGKGNRRSFGASQDVDYATAQRELTALFATKLAKV